MFPDHFNFYVTVVDQGETAANQDKYTKELFVDHPGPGCRGIKHVPGDHLKTDNGHDNQNDQTETFAGCFNDCLDASIKYVHFLFLFRPGIHESFLPLIQYSGQGGTGKV